MKSLIKKLLPSQLLSAYHWLFATGSALLNLYPSRKLFVVVVTGTKGKSTTSEIIHTLLTAAGHKTALASTIRFCIGTKSEPNLFKMTMPGRGFLQSFLRRAVREGCTHAVVEMTSEGAKQFRHLGVEFDALVFTNLQAEHIEAHGGFINYVQAKLSLARHLEKSRKRPRYVVANTDDAHGKDFLSVNVETKVPYSLADAEPYNTDDKSVRFVWKRGPLISVPLPGVFNLYNILAALSLAEAIGIPLEVAKQALERMRPVAGRAERVERGQPFAVVVDYAHTPDSLRALYETFKERRIVAVLGSTGGGRDRWKRAEMGKIADEFADVSILTNEDPYDEDPAHIMADLAGGYTEHKPRIISDRREAIHEALRLAHEGDAVLISGKGTDPYIMGPRGLKEPWSDKKVAEEELEKLGFRS